ncbi:MAG: 30S ribosomal protein S17e [Candidatus Diapherotrites archaeon]|nr:30S ribosomal protein S17e [Candidatus Diapherotrites archaeon]
MGKAVPRRVKSMAAALIEEFPDKFVAKDFEANKKFVNLLRIPVSKSTRNLVAGFITRKVSQRSS